MENTAAVVNPKVSICTTVLNQSEWLREMIASVVAQTYPDWELLIADDGSTEDIKSVVESFNDKRIRFYRFDDNKGGAERLNFLMHEMRGEFFGLLAADEVIYEKKLEQQLEYFSAHAGVDAVWGLPQTGPMGLRPSWEQYTLLAQNRSSESWLRCLLNLENVPLGAGSFLMRSSVLADIGYLDPSLTLFNDHEFYCRFFARSKTGVVLPYRWSNDRPAGPDSVRAKNMAKAQAELAYVHAKHPLILPVSEGKVTCGIPCYNHAKYLPQAVESVMAQTRPVDELIILDDGSTDDFKTVAAELVAKYPQIKVMAFPENMGMQEAHNQMAFRAEGTFFFPLSADDTIEPTFVERCLAEFKAWPWAEFVATQTDFWQEDMKTPAPKEHAFWTIPRAVNRENRLEWLEALRPGNHYFGAGMYRTKVISDIGGWEKEYKVISDYQVYIKLLQRENIRVIEENLTHTRVGANDSILDKKRAEELPWLYFAARKPYYRKHMRVIIATPFYELKGFSPYIVSLAHTLRLLTAVGIDWHFLELSGDSYVHRARNTMCDAFLRDPEATDLFFVDSDMSWNPEAFVKMCMLPDDVIGGTYPVKNNWEAWTSIPNQFPDGKGGMDLRGRDLGDGSALIEAAVLAGGFLRIKRHVLEKFREHYADLWYEEPSSSPDTPNHRFTQYFAAEQIDHKFYGEDHAFAKRLREMGMKMFIYPNIDIVHWGYKPFEGNYDKWLKKAALDTSVKKQIAEKVAAGFVPPKI